MVNMKVPKTIITSNMDKLKRALVLGLFAIALGSCKDKSVNQQGYYAIGKYLYMDFHHRLHTNKDCWRIGDVVEFLDTASIYAKDEYQYCKDCFTDTTYEHVQAILHNDVDRKWLYEKLNEIYNDMPTYQVYIKKLHNPQKVRLLYDVACEQGWDVGSYEDFSKMVGFAQ